MKIALVHDDFSLWVFRKGLISRLIGSGHTVYVVCSSSGYIPLLEAMGALPVPVAMNRFFSPFRDLKLMADLYRIFRREQFDVVHTFAIKPNIFGALAARAAGIHKVILSVTGLGVLKTDEFHNGVKSSILVMILINLYKLACRVSCKIWFQNSDDREFFEKNKMVNRSKAALIRSSGVDVEEFCPESADRDIRDRIKKELNITDSTKVVTMVTRPLWNKGVREFIEASEIIKKYNPHVKFLLVGGIENDNPLSVPEDFLRKSESDNFTWLGFRSEVRELQSISDVSVLPSFYAEGIPRNLLEAMAMGNPIVTTMNVGCREVVEENKNGYIVQTRNSHALASAIDALINDEKKRVEFGYYSRKKVEHEFNEKTVTNRIINELYEASL
jgi:N,N'-diacetylbacillosaminyl-diphospho-undecaprenol alpha-1,3-N-acetylgalactosaminyltransferase